MYAHMICNKNEICYLNYEERVRGEGDFIFQGKKKGIFVIGMSIFNNLA